MEEFLKYLELEKRYSELTIISYRSDLIQFIQFLRKEFDLEQLDEVLDIHIRSWLANLIDGKNSAKSVNRKLSVLRSYYRYLIKQGVINKNPCQKVIGPKVNKRLPVFIEESRMTLLDKVDFVEKGTNDYATFRDIVIVELFYSTGIRRAELIGLKMGDLNLYQKQIRVLGKRNKERIVPLHDQIMQLLNDYLSVRKGFFDSNYHDDWIFLTEKGEKMYPKLVYRLVNSYLSHVSTQDKKSPHVLRHTFATHMLNNGADLNAIKEILGHSSLAATQIYTHNTIEKLKKVYQQAHPKA